MAKGMYIGVNGKARKVKKMYFGVGGVARKVKKAYMGVGGVAKYIFSGTETQITRYKILSLGAAISYPDTASLDNYAVFNVTGGDAYAFDSSLTRTTVTVYGNKLYKSYDCAFNGEYALFGGGTNNSVLVNDVRILKNSGLTVSSASNGLSAARYGMATGCLNDYMVFAGGSNGSALFNTMDIYSSSCTKMIHSLALTTAKYVPIGASAGYSYLLIGGGGYYSQTFYTSIEAFSAGLTKYSNVSPLSYASTARDSVSTPNYALFTNGFDSNVVDAYNTSLTKTNPTALTSDRGYRGTTCLNGFAIFAGGYFAGDGVNTVEVYDPSLTKSISTNLSYKRYALGGATIGDYALFAGGVYNGSTCDKVSVYQATEVETT